MTLPTFVGHVDSYSTGTSTRVMTPHASTADGDLMIVVFGSNGQTISPPTDVSHPWTALRASDTTGTLTTSSWYRVRQAGETSAGTTYAFTIGTGASSTNSILSYRGFDTTLSHMIIGTTGERATTGTSFTNVATSITTTSADNLVVVFSTERTTTSETGVSSISGATADFFIVQNGSTGLETLSVSHINKTTAGATGNVTITYPNTQTTNGLAWQVAIPPAVSNVSPTAAFSTSISEKTVTITSTASDSDGTISTTSYDWGDGNTNSSSSHTYSAYGTYTIVQTVTDNGGATGTISHTVTCSGIGFPGVYRDSGGTNHAGKMWWWDGTAKKDFDETTLDFVYKPTTVTSFLASGNSPWFAAHRGFSYSYPEETLYGYRAATDWGIKAIEISIQKSLDGTYWCFHDATTDRTTGVSGTIASMHDSAISILSNVGTTATGNTTQPSRPVAKLTDVLDLYAPTHVIFIEDKTYANTTAVLNLMDSYGTSGRPASEIFIWKVSQDSAKATFYDPAAARGYHRWAYIFDASMAGSFTALVTSGKADMIGMDFNSSDSTLTAAIAACITNGVRPTGHIITSTTQRDRLLGFGMTGLMVANKDVVTPW